MSWGIEIYIRLLRALCTEIPLGISLILVHFTDFVDGV